MRYRLLVASLAGATLTDVVQGSGDATSRAPLGPFSGIRKARFYLDQDRSLEIDLHASCEDDDGTDLMIEVKDWEQEPSLDVARRFIEVKEALTGDPSAGHPSAGRPSAGTSKGRPCSSSTARAA